MTSVEGLRLSARHYGRQPHGERRALAVGALHRQVAAHQPAEVTANGQPQPGPAVPGSRAGLGLRERLKQPPKLRLGHPDPGVRDRESYELRVAICEWWGSVGRRKRRPYGRGGACPTRILVPCSQLTTRNSQL